VDSDAVLQVIETVRAHPDLDPGFHLLTDHRAVTTPISAEDARRIAAELRGRTQRLESMGGWCWAAVATKPASYGMVRMLSALVEDTPIELEVFTEMEEAEAWLALRGGASRRGT
jgi:hypothetical protein